MTEFDLRAVAVLEPDDPERLTFLRTTDPRTALARGLKEYLEDVELVWEGGRLVSFASAEYAWAEPEVPEIYPAAVLLGAAPAEYDGGDFTPRNMRVADETQRYLRAVSELAQDFELQIWATDPEERMALTAMVEDALNPTDWMFGLRLRLPFYFGAHATYEPQSVHYDDAEDDAQRRWRRAVISVRANVPQYVPVGRLKSLRVRSRLTLEDRSG